MAAFEIGRRNQPRLAEIGGSLRGDHHNARACGNYGALFSTTGRTATRQRVDELFEGLFTQVLHIPFSRRCPALLAPLRTHGRSFFQTIATRRCIVHFDVTDHPGAVWVVQQLREAFPFNTAQRRPDGAAEVVALPRIGGLHHRYEWRSVA